jgi:hypothetical protein
MPRVAGALLRTQSDERLAELAGEGSEGSEGAFEEMVRRHRANLVAFAATIASPGYATRMKIERPAQKQQAPQDRAVHPPVRGAAPSREGIRNRPLLPRTERP